MGENKVKIRVCRICLAEENNETTFRNFFTSSFAENLFFLSNISVLEFHKTAPALICGNCQNDLAVAVRIKKISLVADKFFSKLNQDEELKLIKQNETNEELNVEEISDIKSENEEEITFFGSEAFEEFNDNDSWKNYEDEDEAIDNSNNNDLLSFEEATKSNSAKKKKPTPKRTYTKGGNKEGLCEICGKNLFSYERLQNHISVKHQIIPIEDYFPCPIEGCNKRFKIKLYVDRHIKNVHNEENKNREKILIPCAFCGVLLKSKNSLKQHENRHMIAARPDKILIHYCDLCGYRADKKIAVQYHIERVHLRLRKYKCKLCPADFVHASLLNYHELTIHLNLRKFACRFNCGKNFTRSSCRTIHERIHKNERPYSCKFCERTFVHHSDKRRHELRHTNGIPAKIFQEQFKQGLVQIIQ